MFNTIHQRVHRQHLRVTLLGYSYRYVQKAMNLANCNMILLIVHTVKEEFVLSDPSRYLKQKTYGNILFITQDT